jgi:predicted small secreted protein
MLTSKAPFLAHVLPSPLAGVFIALLLLVLAVSGCNTISGMGEDISAAGKGIDQTSEATKEKMTGKPQSSQPYATTNQTGAY